LHCRVLALQGACMRAGHGTFFWYLYNSSGTIGTIKEFNIKHTLLFMTILFGSVYIVVYTR
jgi:hypothetical protein